MAPTASAADNRLRSATATDWRRKDPCSVYVGATRHPLRIMMFTGLPEPTPHRFRFRHDVGSIWVCRTLGGQDVQTPMIQPRHLIPVVKDLLMDRPASIEDIHALLSGQGISVSVRGLRHVLESYPVHFRKQQDQWHPAVIGTSARPPQSNRGTNTTPAVRSATTSPLPSRPRAAAGACPQCGMSHVDGNTCSPSQVWR